MRQRHVHVHHRRLVTPWSTQTVREYISQEFARSCLVSYECQPRETVHPGWGVPGTEHGGTRFRRGLLDTIGDIGSHRHLVKYIRLLD